MTALVQAGKEIPADPFIITALAEANQWDEGSFVRRIEQGQFQAIVVSSSLEEDKHNRFTVSVAQAVKQRYAVGKEFGHFKVYLPR
jgi:hypothetical protein